MKDQMGKSLTEKHFLDSEGARKRGRLESIEHNLHQAQQRHEREMFGDDEGELSEPSCTQHAPSPDYRQGHGDSERPQSGNVVYESPER